jgi:phosphate-selective porin OprO and OprP
MRKTSILCAIAVATSATSATFAAEAFPHAFEKRLRKLEEEVQALRKENQQLKSALGEGKTPAIDVKAAGKEATLQLGGLIQAQADFLDRGDSRWGSDNDRFYLRRARVNASGTFLEYVDFKIELELSGSLGEASSLRAALTDGYVNYNRLDWANFKFGQFKTPFGYEQLSSDTKLYTIERSLPNDRLTQGRQLGVQAWGNVLDKRLSYAAGIFNGNGANNSGNDNDSFLFAERLSGVPWRGKLCQKESNIELGLNGYLSDDKSVGGLGDFGFDSTPTTAGNDGIFAGYRRGAGADAQFHAGPFDLAAEYLWTRFEPQNRLPATAVEAQGWYLQGAYSIIPKLQAVVKFETLDLARNLDGDSTDIWTFGLNYYLKGHDVKLQLNYLLYDAPGQPDNRQKILMRFQTLF